MTSRCGAARLHLADLALHDPALDGTAAPAGTDPAVAQAAGHVARCARCAAEVTALRAAAGALLLAHAAPPVPHRPTADRRPAPGAPRRLKAPGRRPARWAAAAAAAAAVVVGGWAAGHYARPAAAVRAQVLTAAVTDARGAVVGGAVAGAEPTSAVLAVSMLTDDADARFDAVLRAGGGPPRGLGTLVARGHRCVWTVTVPGLRSWAGVVVEVREQRSGQVAYRARFPDSATPGGTAPPRAVRGPRSIWRPAA